jgi:TPR repeat protein
MTEQNTLSISELKQQANEGDAQAQFALGLYYSTKIEEGLEFERAEGWEFKSKLFDDYLYASICDKSFDHKIDCAFTVAQKNKETNDETAFTWFKKAAEKGIMEAQYAVARSSLGVA